MNIGEFSREVEYLDPGAPGGAPERIEVPPVVFRDEGAEIRELVAVTRANIAAGCTQPADRSH